eukprot:1581027-Pyramimonas_sp.AAC.1
MSRSTRGMRRRRTGSGGWGRWKGEREEGRAVFAQACLKADLEPSSIFTWLGGCGDKETHAMLDSLLPPPPALQKSEKQRRIRWPVSVSDLGSEEALKKEREEYDTDAR